MSEDFENQDWYVLRENQESDGPFSLRDIDVMYKTFNVRSNTLVWREGMEQWKPLFKVDELRKLIDEAVAELQNLPDINDTNHQNNSTVQINQENSLNKNASESQISKVLRDPSGIIPSSEELRQIVSSAIEQIDHEHNLIDIPDETLNEEEKALKQKQIEKQQK